jgi:PAS domain S-box-containing protein
LPGLAVGDDALREDARRFRLSFDLAPVGLAHVSLGGECFAANRRLCALLGYSREQLVGRRMQDLTHRDDLAGDLGQIVRLIAGEIDTYERRKRYLRSDGAFVWARVTATLAHDAGGAASYVIAAIEALSDVERADAERLASASARSVAEARLRGMFAHSSLPTSIYDRDGRFAYVNPAFERLWGVRVADVAANYRVTDDPQLETLGILALVRQVFLDGTAVVAPPVPAHHSSGRGGAHWVRAHLYPVRDDAGDIDCVVQVSEDVTRQVATEAELARALADERAARAEAETARAEAERASRAKSAFLTTMSHELRTPLNAIQGYAQLLELGVPGAVNEAQRAHLARIQHSQRYLLRLINDVLDYARIEARHVTYDIGAVGPGDVVAQILPMVAPQAAAKSIALMVDELPSVAASADGRKLEQVLLNLLSNAIKFTPAGGRVVVSGTYGGADDGASGTVALRVTDSGPGVPMVMQSAVFDPFVRVDVKREQRQEGTGLGLAISREFVRGMGGDVRIESEFGLGATLIVSLPQWSPTSDGRAE